MGRTPNTEIIDIIRNRILSGEFDVLPFLPSERTFCKQLDAGRGVVQAALRMLQQEGLIRLVPSKGAVICREMRKSRLERFIVCLQDHRHLTSHAYEFTGLLTGVCMAAADNYAEAIVSFTHSGQSVENLIARYRSGDIQGVIFIESGQAEIIDALIRASIPYVIANEENNSPRICCRMDFRMIGRTAGQYIAAAGHREIGVVAGSLERFIYKEMLAGFRGALAEEEIKLCQDHIFALESNFDEPDEKLRKLLQSRKRPTAFFAMRDKRARALYQACNELGLRVPEDISVIGYDNITWPAGQIKGLTTIEQPVYEIGDAAVAMLEEWWMSGKIPSNRLIPCRLIERTSVKNR